MTNRSHPLNLMEIEGLVDEAMAGQKTDTLTIEYKVHHHAFMYICMVIYLDLKTLKTTSYAL